jgi:hypothetical protein
LDAVESADGVSGVVGDFCQHFVYDVINGQLTRVSHDTTEGACGDAAAP